MNKKNYWKLKIFRSIVQINIQGNIFNSNTQKNLSNAKEKNKKVKRIAINLSEA